MQQKTHVLTLRYCAYMQSHVLTHCLHTLSPGPLISGFIFDINLLGWGWLGTVSLPVVGIIEVNFSKRVFIIAACAVPDKTSY